MGVQVRIGRKEQQLSACLVLWRVLACLLETSCPACTAAFSLWPLEGPFLQLSVCFTEILTVS